MNNIVVLCLFSGSFLFPPITCELLFRLGVLLSREGMIFLSTNKVFVSQQWKLVKFVVSRNSQYKALFHCYHTFQLWKIVKFIISVNIQSQIFSVKEPTEVILFIFELEKFCSITHCKCYCDKEFSTIWSLWGKMCLSFCTDIVLGTLSILFLSVRRAEFPLKVLGTSVHKIYIVYIYIYI